MALPTKTLPQFQEYIWMSLPMRKHMAGKEAIYDAVAVAIQEWPDEQLSACRAGDESETVAAEELTKSVKRHLSLAYGDKKFGSLWIVALQILLPIIVDQILKWWRRRKENQGRIRLWRRKWVNGEA